MGINVGETLMGLVTTSGIYQYLTNPLALIMVAIACVLLYLAIVKQFEPLLLLPIAFGMLLTNLPGATSSTKNSSPAAMPTGRCSAARS